MALLASASQFHIYLPWVNACLASCLNCVLNVNALVDAFKLSSRGLLCDCKIFAYLRITFVSSSSISLPAATQTPPCISAARDLAAATSLATDMTNVHCTNIWASSRAYKQLLDSLHVSEHYRLYVSFYYIITTRWAFVTFSRRINSFNQEGRRICHCNAM